MVVECCCYIPYQLALMLVLTCAPSVLTFAACALNFAPCASINQCKYSTYTHGGGHWMHLALVSIYLQPLVETLLAPVVLPLVATCTSGLSLSTHWLTYSTCIRVTCIVCWYIYIYYIYIYIYIYIQRSLIRPGLIGFWTKITGVPPIGLPAVIPLGFSMIIYIYIYNIIYIYIYKNLYSVCLLS